MKPLCTSLAIAIAASLQAAVPIAWRSNVAKPDVERREAYHGTTLDLEATLLADGSPLAVTNNAAWLYWQTNGMGSAFWSAPASVSGSVVRASFTPEMDPGAPAVNGYLGTPREHYAAFQLRFRPSPGALPNEIELPPRVVDFARVAATNAPWALDSAAAKPYPFTTPAFFTQMDDTSVATLVPFANNQVSAAWEFSGDPPASGEHWQAHHDGSSTWSLWSVPDGAEFDSGTLTSYASGEAHDCYLLFAWADATKQVVATRPPSSFAVAVGAAATTNVQRDLWFSINALAVTNAPSLTWGAAFHPIGGDNDNLAVEAGKMNVYMISEFWPDNFMVARQAFTNLVTETAQ